MIGIIVFAHGALAKNFIDVLTLITGKQEQIEAVDVQLDMTPEEVEQQLDRAIKKLNQGEGVIVLADLFGGSPANCSLARMVPGKVEVVTGLNLAMLLKVVDLRARDLADPAVMARAIAREAKENIVLASEIL